MRMKWRASCVSIRRRRLRPTSDEPRSIPQKYFWIGFWIASEFKTHHEDNGGFRLKRISRFGPSNTRASLRRINQDERNSLGP
jgi:hypothetical protein